MGGLTVAHAVHRRLPNEHIIYFGDTKHLPYGEKSPTTIQQYACEIVEYLIQRDCKAIVIACNSASTAAGELLQERYGATIPLINVVDPLVEHTLRSNYKKIGLIATNATIQSGKYQEALSGNQDLEVIARATPLFVPVIEEGYALSEITSAILKTYFEDPALDQIEAILLACTHYPLIIPMIEAVLPRMDILDSTEVTAIALENHLKKANLLSASRKKDNEFLVTDYTQHFEEQAELFFGKDLDLQLIKL